MASGARTVDLGTPAEGERVAFFLIQDGFNKFGNAAGQSVVRYARHRGAVRHTTPAFRRSCRARPWAHYSGATIFHSLSTLNPADAMQVLSGVAPGGRELLIGFEDLPTVRRATTTSRIS